MDASGFQKLLKRIEVVRAPTHALSTFGATRLTYHLVSSVEGLRNRTRLRTGTVLSEKPKIITPQAFAERFQGFGKESEEFARWLTPAYRDLLRALEYNFKNQDIRTRVVSGAPKAVTERILADISRRESRDEAVIRCPDSAWGLALMKLTLDETARSFPVHVRDLERRGLFHPEAKEEDRRRREIDQLFAAAGRDRAALEALGRKLREYGLFEEYEDRFLSYF
ncbi:MAG TPA: hypothetical protein DEB40_03050 [Elusimicrobia bacterium]|nr:hypothetical protein [Elusimicrobiota bacterium]HBT60708.1 hypothetical protein [Elusimicrobiota bacterium]